MSNSDILNSSVLGMPMQGSKMMMEKRAKVLRQRNLQKGSLYLGLAAVLLVAYSALFLFSQVKLYLNSDVEIASLKQEIQDYKEVKIPNLEKEVDLHKAAYDEKTSESESAISKIFPETSDKLGITKRLENFAVQVAAKPPFELNGLSFGEPKKEAGYTVLPISMSVYASRANFDRFLQLINLSGRIEKDVAIRLMEISNINIRYRGVDSRTGQDLGVDFTVQLKAYSKS